MADEHSSKDRPSETYVKRTGREINDLRAAFRKSWVLGISIVVILTAFAVYKLDLFKKKDDPKDNSADIVKLANHYIDLNAKYQKLQEEVQQKHDADKEAEVNQLKQRIEDQQREINAKAQSAGQVKVPDSTANGGQQLVPASAVAAWTACVSTVSASGHFGPFSFGGSSTTSDRCNAILKQASTR